MPDPITTHPFVHGVLASLCHNADGPLMPDHGLGRTRLPETLRHLYHAPGVRFAGRGGRERPLSRDGAVTCHFSQTSVSKTSPILARIRAAKAGRSYQGSRAVAHEVYIERPGAAERLGPARSRRATGRDGREQQAYLERDGAVEADPDDALALASFGTIGDTPEERARFWTLVEESERSARGDRIGIAPGQAPDWWARALSALDDAPEAARDILRAAGPQRSAPLTLALPTEDALALWQWAVGLGADAPVTIAPGRGGRIQTRIIAELPHEIDARQRLAIVEAFTGKLAGKGFPFWAVVHAPDARNDARNVHVHIVYYDRPARRMPHPNTGAPSWDFAITCERRRANRTRVPTRPYRQPKDRASHDRAWIGELRTHWGVCCNAVLAEAGIAKRYDLRTYATIGIGQAPGIHTAAYTRVSTGPQAEADLSLPDQANQILGWCQANGYVLSATFEERGASATSDKGRPQLKALLDQACDGSRPYDVAIVHSLSRFFRNQFALEGARRRLAEHGVSPISITQPLAGNDPASHLIRIVLAMFDEYRSWENRKHVKRSMNENARQGFWNGSKAPYGYRTVEAGQKGRRTKKVLAIDPVEAEVVRLMYRLIVEGDGQSGPMGVKSVCTWLNARGILTRKLCRWGIGPLHDILTRPLYTGTYQFNRRDSKTRQRNPTSEIVEAPAPAIVSQELYQAVQDTLRSRRPSEAPPREVTGPVLLTGLAVCGRCGGGMTMATGTSSTGKVYRYYKCSPQMRIGEKACRGMNIGMAKLDALVTTALEQRLLTTERLQEVLSELAARRQARVGPAQVRMQTLAEAMADADTPLKRLYSSIEDGIADGADPTLKQRLDTLRTDRDQARAALERLREQIWEPVAIAPERVATFASEMRPRLREGEVPFRKAYIRAFIDRVEVQPDEIRIAGRRDVLERAVANGPAAAPGVRSSVREWRTRHDSNV